MAHELSITRTFDAPRAVVWKAWTDPAHLQHWMGPRGFVAQHLQYDVGPAGKWSCSLHSEDGSMTDLWQSGTYLEVVEPERLVFTFRWDEHSTVPRYETVVTITFEDLNGKTLMRFHQAPFPNAADRDGHQGGWNSSFDRLEDFVRRN